MSSCHPFEQLAQDWQAAKDAQDPNAPFCTLMTVANDSVENNGVRPTGRILGLREITQDGTLLVYTNDTSPKFQQLSTCPRYEILLFWTRPQMIQYRLAGSQWSTVPVDEMKEQWDKHKPYRSKLLDYYYNHKQPQSTVLQGGRQQFLDEMNALNQQFQQAGGGQVPFQSVNVGLLLKPSAVEEWRSSNEDRLHERYVYKQEQNGKRWAKETLVP